jgi:hypothetical protein
MVRFPQVAALALFFFFISSSAHPGEIVDHLKMKQKAELHQRVAADGANTLRQCSGSLEVRQLNNHNIARRQAVFQELRQSVGLSGLRMFTPFGNRPFVNMSKQYTNKRSASPLKRRNQDDLIKWDNVNHEKNREQYNPDDSNTLFGSTTSCILTPESDPGPFYYPGEMIRWDIRENQPGVQLWFEIQIIDVTTCKPIKDMWVDLWAVSWSFSF